MAALRHGFFFFFLSKLFAVNCSTTNNPTSPVHYGGPVNGMFNSWAGQQPAVTQGMTNNYNAYSSNPQGVQPNSVYPDYQQQINYGQQMTTPREPQSYGFQEQQYSQNPPQTAQPNPVVQDQMEKSQSQQSNSNSAYQPISTQYYPNYNYFNTDFNQPYNQEKQSASSLPNTQPTKSQAQYVQPQLNQYTPPSQNGHEIPQSATIPISSSPNEYQNQFSSKTNPQPSKATSPATFQQKSSEAQPYNLSLSNFKPQSFPMTSSLKPQQYQSTTLEKNAQQQLQPTNSPTPLQFKKPEVPPKSSTQSQSQFSQSNSFPNESQSSSLPVSSVSQQFTGQTIPTMKNTSQPPQPTKLSPSSQLKTSEVKPEPNSQSQPQFPQSNFSLNQSKPPSLPTSSLSQQFTGQTIPIMQYTPQPPQPSKSSPPPQLTTSGVIPEPNSQIKPQFSQSNLSSNQSKPPSFPVSSSLEPSQLSQSSNPINSPQAVKLFPPIKFKTPQAQLDTQNEPQSPQSNSFSNQSKPPSLLTSSSFQPSQLNSSPIIQNSPQPQLPTKSSPLLLQTSKVQSESKTPPQMNIQSSYVNSSPYQFKPQSFSESSPLQSSPLQSKPTGQNSPQPTKLSPPLQSSQDNFLTNQFPTQSIPVSFPLQQSNLQPKPLKQNTPQSPQPTKPFPPKKSNIPDELPVPNNKSSTLTLNAPIISISNNLEPSKTLPQLFSSDWSQYFVQDKDITILNSKSNLPNTFNGNNNLPSGLGDDKIANDNTLGSQNEINNEQPFDDEDEESNLKSKLKKSRVPFVVFETPPDSYDIDNSIHLSDYVKSNTPKLVNGLGAYDRPNTKDIEEPKNAEEENVEFRVFADPNDIHVININPKQTSPSTTVLNTQPTRTSWSVPQWPNNAGVQQSDYSDQLLNSLFNSNTNEMPYNQIPTDTPNNNYDYTYYNQDSDRKFSNTPQDISKSANQPSSITEDSGHIYKQIDLKNPSSTASSWSLRKQDYSKNKRPNSNNGISWTSVSETPSTFNQNNNQYTSSLSLDYISVQNMISAISSAVGAPPEGTKAIFDLTQASFPNANVIQQLNLTYSVVQSIILSLRKILNTVVNHLFGQRVKRDFNMLGPMSNISPKTTTEQVHNLPAIAGLNKKDYQSASNSNTNSYYNQPTTASSSTTNTYRQPTATTGIFSNQPYSQQYFPSKPYVDTKNQQQKQMFNSEINEDDMDDDDDDDDESQNSNRTAQQAPPNTRGYISDVLANEIRTQVYSNLPDSYSSNGPEVEEYCRQLMFTVETFFRNQINNVIQGHSPTKNMFSVY